MSDSSEAKNGRADAYQALIKPGDAVQTPDGELWVVDAIAAAEPPLLALVSAYQATDGLIYADAYNPIHTSVPCEMATKVADARQVRR